MPKVCLAQVAQSTLTVKNFFLTSNLNLSPLSLKPLPLSYHYKLLSKVPFQLSQRPPSKGGGFSFCPMKNTALGDSSSILSSSFCVSSWLFPPVATTPCQSCAFLVTGGILAEVTRRLHPDRHCQKWFFDHVLLLENLHQFLPGLWG